MIFRIVCIFSIVFYFCFLITGCKSITSNESHIDDNIDNYSKNRENVRFAEDYLPILEDVSGECVSYSYKKTDILVYTTETIALFIKCSSDSYQKQKEEMLRSNDILVELRTNSEGDYLTPPPEFCYKGYAFFTCVNSDAYYGCKSVLFIGYNDETQRLALCYFWDADRDIMFYANSYTDESIIEFMDTYFYWNEL